MFDPLYNLRLQIRGWLIDNQQTQAQLSKLSGLSEGTISDLLSGKCSLALPNYVRLQQIVNSPLPDSPNFGARLTKIQTLGRKLKGDLNINMETARAQQMQLQRGGVETMAMKMEKIINGEEVSLIDRRTEDTI